jgi:hypothetical protein
MGNMKKFVLGLIVFITLLPSISLAQNATFYLKPIFHIFQIPQSQGNTIAYFVTLPICILNVLPFLAFLFPLSKLQKRIVLIAIIGIDTAIIATIALLTHQHVYNIGYDTWMHLTIIQRGVENGLFTGDPYYLGFPTTPHYSIVDVFYVLLSAISGIAPHLFWGNLSFIFVALIFLACIWWYKELFDDSALGWLVGLLFILSITIKWHYATYPRNIALIFFFLSHLFYFRSVRTKQDRYTLYSGISIGFCIMTHLFTGVMCFTSLVTYALTSWGVDAIHRKPRLWNEDLRRLAFIPISLIVSSPWMIMFGKQALTHTEISMSHYSLPDWNVETTILGWTFKIYKPKLFWDIYPSLLWILAGVGLLICLYYIIRGSYKPLHVFLVSAAIIPPIVLLTPFYSTIVNIFGEWMPSRFIRIMPVPPLAVLSIGIIIRFLASIRVNHRIQRAIIRSSGIVLGLIFMIIIIPPIVTIQKDLYKGRNQVLTTLYVWNNDFNALKDKLKNKVVLTDPWTSYILSYYTDAYTVAIPAAHGSPYINHELRLEDVSVMFNPQTDPVKRYELIDKYQVDYVMINLRPKFDNTASGYGLIGDFYQSSIKETFDKQKRFKLIYDVNGLFIYDLSR